MMRITIFGAGSQGQTAWFHPFRWRQATTDYGPTIAQWLVTVKGRETISPAGISFNDVETWVLK